MKKTLIVLLALVAILSGTVSFAATENNTVALYITTGNEQSYMYANSDVEIYNTQKLILVQVFTDRTVKTVDSNEIIWSSDKKTIAEINNKGIVKGINPGNVNITANYKGKISKFNMTVSKYYGNLNYLKITSTKSNIKVGEILKVKLFQNYRNGNVQLNSLGANWYSSNPSIATVTDGAITGVKSGDVIIYANFSGATCKYLLKVE